MGNGLGRSLLLAVIVGVGGALLLYILVERPRDEALSEAMDVRVPPFRVATLSPDTASLAIGETITLTATVRDRFDEEVSRQVEWLTADPSIAEISADGSLVARGPGVTQVVARSGLLGDTVQVRVISEEPELPGPMPEDTLGEPEVRSCPDSVGELHTGLSSCQSNSARKDTVITTYRQVIEDLSSDSYFFGLVVPIIVAIIASIGSCVATVQANRVISAGESHDATHDYDS